MYSSFRALVSGQQRPVAGLRSDAAKTLPLTRGKRVRGANAAAVDAKNATRSAEGIMFAYVSQKQRRMLSVKYPRGAIREHKSSN